MARLREVDLICFVDSAKQCGEDESTNFEMDVSCRESLCDLLFFRPNAFEK